MLSQILIDCIWIKSITIALIKREVDARRLMCRANRQIKHLSHSFTLSSPLFRGFLSARLVQVLTLAVPGGPIWRLCLIAAFSTTCLPRSSESCILPPFLCWQNKRNPRFIYIGGTFTGTSRSPEVLPLAAQGESLKKAKTWKNLFFHFDLVWTSLLHIKVLSFWSKYQISRLYNWFYWNRWVIFIFKCFFFRSTVAQGHSGGKQDAQSLKGGGITLINLDGESLSVCCVL